MINLLITVIASVFLVVGVISMMTPIPGGVIMIAASLTTLTCTSPRARSIIKDFRERSDKINKLFYFLEEKVGTKITIIGDALMLTRPGVQSDRHE